MRRTSPRFHWPLRSLQVILSQIDPTPQSMMLTVEFPTVTPGCVSPLDADVPQGDLVGRSSHDSPDACYGEKVAAVAGPSPPHASRVSGRKRKAAEMKDDECVSTDDAQKLAVGGPIVVVPATS